MNGDVFAIKPTIGNDNVEIFWERTNVLGMVWPYEMHQYTARWPTNLPAKYQLYARGSVGKLREECLSARCPEPEFDALSGSGWARQSKWHNVLQQPAHHARVDPRGL